MKKVLFVISSLKSGGAERALANITTHFPQEWQIDILVNNDMGIEYSYRGNIITLGIMGKVWKGSVFFHIKLLLKRIKKLRCLKRYGNYQACISFLDSANIANILSGKRYCQIILSVRTSLQQSSNRPEYRYLVNPMVKLLYNRADKTVAVSKGVEKELLEVFRLKKDKVVTIENGFDVQNIKKMSCEGLPNAYQKIITGRKVIVTAGRLSNPKGQWHLIRAFSKVIRQIPEALLVILGSGELEGYLKQLVGEYGMGDSVFFTDFVSNPYQYISNADIFVFPSLYEGFPNALAEAVCLGIPCIATDFHTGAREILAPELLDKDCVIENITEGSYGILTPVCSGKHYKDVGEPLEWAEQCLARAMVRFLLDERKREEYREKSICRRNSLKIDTIIEKWIEIVRGNFEEN